MNNAIETKFQTYMLYLIVFVVSLYAALTLGKAIGSFLVSADFQNIVYLLQTGDFRGGIFGLVEDHWMITVLIWVAHRLGNSVTVGFVIAGIAGVSETESLIDRLKDLLPHGSGIDYNWSIEQKRNGKFYTSNAFHAMDENGMYCHVYDFTAVILYNGENARENCRLCNGTGKRTVAEMAKLRGEEPFETADFLLYKMDIEIHGWESIGEIDNAWFHCNYCNGKGYLPVKPFTLDRFNFRGQREYSCCGYGIKDYIEQTLYETLSYNQK